MVIKGLRPVQGITLGLVALLIAACGPTKTPEQAVRDRAMERWEAILAKDYAAEYALHSPGFRSVKSERAHVNYRGSQPVRWTGYEIQEVTCESAEVCEANLKIDYEVQAQIAFVGTQKAFSFVTETWIYSGRNWFYLPKELER